MQILTTGGAGLIGSAELTETNIVGGYLLLEAVRQYYNQLDIPSKTVFRFHHISTDDVYGNAMQIRARLYAEDRLGHNIRFAIGNMSECCLDNKMCWTKVLDGSYIRERLGTNK